MYFRQIEDAHLAQYAYLIGCQATGEALLIDPERDVDRYLELAAQNGLRIVAVTETHIHADFVSGVRELARRIPVTVYLSQEGGPDWQYQWQPESHSRIAKLKHGDIFRVGNIEVEAMHTPGHTPEHLCFLITDRGSGADAAMGVVSGDFVFVGDVGRPDLLESAAGVAGAKEPSARALYLSLRDFLTLPDYLQIWPGHGAGSVCGKALGAVPDTTVGYERRFNRSLLAAQSGEERFVREILHGQPEPPLYFAQMKRWNKMGPPLLPEKFSLAQVKPEQLPELALRDDVIVVDARERVRFAAGHVPKSIWIPLSLSFPTYAGSFIRPEQNIVLICNPEQAQMAVRLLWRVGLDNILGFVPVQEFQEWSRTAQLVSLSQISFAQALTSGDPIVDVRGESEYEEGHLPSAICIPHTRILTRLDDLPRDSRIVLHCSASSRSAGVAALLARMGYDVAAVDEPIEAVNGLLVRERVPA